LWVEDEFQVTVTPVNDAPVADDDSYEVNEDLTLTVFAPGVLAGDTDLEGQTLSAAVVDQPLHGTVSLNTNGSFVYVPTANYNGPDSFTYRASDGALPSNLATVSITVRPVNDRPAVNPDAYDLDEDIPLSISAPGLLGNDTDIDGNTLTAQKVTDPLHGSLTLNANGSFLYIPALNYNGPDSFTYRVTDGSLTSDPTTVSLTVWAVNDSPVAFPNQFSTAEDTPFSQGAPGLLGNDEDAEGESLTAIKVSDPQHGVVTVNADGSFNYIPDANYFGPDSFTYKANDGNSDSAPATVSFIVTPVNDGPTAVDDTATVRQGKSQTILVLGNDTDPEGDLLRVSAITQGTKGTVGRTATSVIYTPRTGALGADEFTYSVTDDRGGVATATVRVDILDGIAPRISAVRLYYGPSSTAVVNFAALSRSVLPWAGVTRMEFTFTEDVVVAANALTLTAAGGAAVDFTSAYDPVTRTLALVRPEGLPIGRYTLRLSGAAVVDSAGNALTANWAKTFAVLPGDFDGNGRVDNTDLLRIRRNYTRPGRVLNRMADVNGDGVVDVQDYNLASGNRGRRVW
jgi:VCBS repeat-containing protein